MDFLTVRSLTIARDKNRFISMPVSSTPNAKELVEKKEDRIQARPSLEYRHALDLCAVELARMPDSILIITSSSFYARELLERLRTKITILKPPDNEVVRDIESLKLINPGEYGISVQAFEKWNARKNRVVVWAEPQSLDGQFIAHRIYESLIPGGCLYVFNSGLFARFLPEWRNSIEKPAKNPVGFYRSKVWVRRAGFVVEKAYGLRNPLNILIGIMAHLLVDTNHRDKADRFYKIIRDNLVFSSRKAAWSDVSIMVARKPEK